MTRDFSQICSWYFAEIGRGNFLASMLIVYGPATVNTMAAVFVEVTPALLT
jgi:hypothetical protein